MTNSQNKVVRKVFFNISTIICIFLFATGCLALYANNYVSRTVRNELTAQKIYFPKAGSPGFDASTYPDLQKYAGQLLDSPDKAKAYANGYIGRHLAKIAGGKVYAEVSDESMKDPSNQKLQQQKQLLFQGDTLRTMLLTSGYGFGMIGQVAGIVALIMYFGSGFSALLAVYFRARL